MKPKQATKKPAGLGSAPVIGEKFGDYLRRLRTAAGLTLDDAAAEAGCTPVYLGELERGTRFGTRIGPDLISGLAKALKVSRSHIERAVVHNRLSRLESEVDAERERLRLLGEAS